MTSDRVVLVTGAAGGIGSALVAAFLGSGDHVFAADRDTEGLLRLARDSSSPERLHTRTAELGDQAQVSALAASIKASLGKVDVLVNCAGWFPMQSFDTMTLEQWRSVMTVNLESAFLVTRAVLPLLRGRGWGRIVNIGSGSVFSGTPGLSHYVAAKSGMVGLTRSLAHELGRDGITVNVVAPGLTTTPAALGSFPAGAIEAQPHRRALPRAQVAQDVVGPVLFFASSAADFVTGQTLVVDGGVSML